MKQIEIKNLKFGYNENLILKGVNLDLDQGDFAVISGENGSGKSTLIKLIPVSYTHLTLPTSDLV